MNDTKELKSEYVALGRGSWEGITNSSLLQAARCGLLLQDTGKGPRKQAEPGSVRTLVTSSSWRLSPAFLAFLVASDKSSFQPGRLPAAPKENQVRAGGKSTLTNYLPHSPPRSEPSPPRARSPSRRSSGKWALAGGRARSPADARQRKRAASGEGDLQAGSEVPAPARQEEWRRGGAPARWAAVRARLEPTPRSGPSQPADPACAPRAPPLPGGRAAVSQPETGESDPATLREKCFPPCNPPRKTKMSGDDGGGRVTYPCSSRG